MDAFVVKLVNLIINMQSPASNFRRYRQLFGIYEIVKITVDYEQNMESADLKQG